jgi:CRP/FNR family cyclic AMP-dependent transcriptional regulator
MGTSAAPRRQQRLGSSVRAQAATRLCGLLDELPQQHLVDLLRHSHGSTGRRGDQIVAPGDDVVTVILHGVTASRTATLDGEHLVHALHGPGDTHGVTAVLGHPEAANELIAVADVDALVLPGAAVRELVERVPAAARACLATVTADHARLRVEQARFAASSTSARVEHRLLELAARFGEEDRGRILVTLPLTQEMLASWAHASRESTAKVLQDLRRAGIVTTGRCELVIDDLAALRERRRERPDATVAAILRELG